MLRSPLLKRHATDRKKFRINQHFGRNDNSFYKQMGLKGHNGIDFRTKYEFHYLFSNVFGFRKVEAYTAQKAGKIKTQAVIDGTVQWAGKDSGGGLGVRYITDVLTWDKEDTDLGDGSVIHTGEQFKLEITHYHLDSIRESITVGKKISEGVILGMCGNSGRYTTGAHLHFATRFLRKEGSKYVANMNNGYSGCVNPIIFLNKDVLYV